MERIEKEAFLAHTKLPTFQRKVEKTKKIIQEALEIAHAYVAVSWGKDSVVMLHLVQSICPDVLAFHYGSIESSTGIVSNFPEVIKAYRDKFPTNYQELIAEPEWAFTPDTVRDRIQSIIDHRYQVAFVGVRAEESKYRRMAISQYGVIHQYKSDKLWRCFPLSYWQTADIWAYTCKYDLPFLDAYAYSDRTNPHASFWFSQDKDIVKTQKENIKKNNPKLNQFLEERYATVQSLD